jgi:hypothetical protein
LFFSHDVPSVFLTDSLPLCSTAAIEIDCASPSAELFEDSPFNAVIKPHPNDRTGRMLVWNRPLQHAWILEDPCATGSRLRDFAQRSTYFEVKAGRGGKRARRRVDRYLRKLQI